MKPIRSLRNFAAIVLAPVFAAQWSLLPFWMSDPRPDWLAFIQFALTTFFVPTWLGGHGSLFVRGYYSVSGLAALAALAVAFVANAFLGYANWGCATGGFWRPDIGTFHVTQFSVLVGFCVLVAPMIIAGTLPRQ